jgi:hypothetical protein
MRGVYNFCLLLWGAEKIEPARRCWRGSTDENPPGMDAVSVMEPHVKAMESVVAELTAQLSQLSPSSPGFRSLPGRAERCGARDGINRSGACSDLAPLPSHQLPGGPVESLEAKAAALQRAAQGLGELHGLAGVSRVFQTGRDPLLSPG